MSLRAIDAGARKLIVNMARVPYMDSSGLGELISCYTTLQRLSGRVKLLHLSDRLQYLLAHHEARSHVFETFDSEPAAVSSFAPRSERKARPCCRNLASEFFSLA